LQTFITTFTKINFYILIPVKPLKAGPNKPNISKRVTPKSNPHKPKDYQQSKVSKKVNIRNNGFKDPSSWESIEGGLRISEDRPYKPVES